MRILRSLTAAVLLLSAHDALAQAVVDLTAAPGTTVMPDGQSVPMWGYTCSVDKADTTGATACGAANPAPSAGGWAPVVIRVQAPPAGNGTLTINLTNNLSFANGNNIPTSLVVVGQVGGGLGNGGTTAPSPAHASQQVTWPTIDPTNTNPPPPQLPRVQSFATEVLAGQGTGSTVQLRWADLKPGTYLIESGTHPSIQVPMGLYGILVVSPAGQAYPSVVGSKFDADLPIVLSEIDPLQNAAVNAAVNTQGFSETAVWSGQNSSAVTALALANPGSGYTSAPTVTIAPPAGSGGIQATASATINATGAISSITIISGGSGYSGSPAVTISPPASGTTATATALAGACGNATTAAANTCYPPAVNYSPRYYLVNGVSFDRTNLTAATLGILGSPATVTTGNLLVRLVNAGLRMHVPAFVNLPMTLVAEDGNPVPGVARVQNEVFMAAGKSYDVMVQPVARNGTYTAATYPLFDRQLSLSTNNARDGGMQAYVAVNGGATTGAGSNVSAATLAGAGNRVFYCVNGNALKVTDPAKGLLAGVTGANGVALVPNSVTNGGSVTLAANGTFTYNPPSGASCSGQFGFTVNARNSFTATITECDASSHTASGCSYGGPPVLRDDMFTSTNAKRLAIGPPGILMNDVDPSGLPLTVDTSTVTAPPGVNLTVNPDGSFIAELQVSATGAQTATFTYNVKNSQQTAASKTATVTVNFPARSGLKVALIDPKKIDPATKAPLRITDYRWIIEEDRTFWIDPKCQVNTEPNAARPTDSYGRPCAPLPVESVGYNFHTAHMPVVATGCFRDPSDSSSGTIVSCEAGQTLLGSPAICDVGNGACRTSDANGNPLTLNTAQLTPLDPGDVALDPTKHYYISVMPADGINPTVAGVGGPVTVNGATRQFDPAKDCPNVADFAAGTGKCGHNMSGGPIPPLAAGSTVWPTVTIPLAETPLPVAKIAVLVYEDDYPLNGENDAGGGVDILAPNEPGLGSFQVVLFDQAGQLGDNTGQPTYDMFNMPLSNSLVGTTDPMTGLNACPVTSNTDNLVGMIVTCPKYESDGKTLSPLAGQAVIDNLYPGLYEVQAFPATDRIERGEEWLQTNTLDGGKPHEAFIRPGEPAYFQEFGPGGFHVQIGFANPKIINDRRHNASLTGLCDPAPSGGGLTCNSKIIGQVDGDHMSRTPDQRTYDSGNYNAFQWSTCYVSVGVPDDMDIAFAKCNADGSFEIDNMPDGTYKVAVFDQWNDIMLDGLVTSVTVNGTTPVTLTAIQWRTNLYTRTYLDLDGNGIPTRDGSGNDLEQGVPLVPINIRYRDGSVGFKNQTDLNGYATYNEIFPLMNWLVVEPDTTRYKLTGEHVIYDAGGPDDCSPAAVAAYGGNGNCSVSAANLAGTKEFVPLPKELRVPGAVYCTDADCLAASFLGGNYYAGKSGSSGPDPSTTALSSGRIDPPGSTEGFQGLLGQHNFIDFGFKPFKAATASTPGENGGISGLVVYASTRPFDDPTFLVQNPWEPAIPHVRVNLYKETTAQDGTQTLTLIDSTLTSSWDDWAQGFRTDGSGTGALVKAADGGNIPNMNCPGQDPTSGFFATLQGSKMWLDTADVNGSKKTLAYKSQFKCFDGWAMLNQIQPAPYDGKYAFPSVVDRDPVTGRPSGTGSLNGIANTSGLAGTNCTVCIANPDDGNPMLPAGKYVVEVVVPPGFELVKEEDKNILMGDIFVAPVTQQFAGLGNVFILPDQAAMNAYYNANNAVNPTANLGAQQVPSSEILTTTQQNWPCVGQLRIVPDTMSLYPTVGQTAPFAGASRPLCDRKEVTLTDQMSTTAHFFVFTSNHIAGHFTGVMTNDMASEFDPFSPQFGEKFGAPNLPVNMRDFDGNQVTRVYGDQWGVYNGLYPSSWEVNPPNPTGYGPQMSVACMNDPGPIPDPSGATNPDGTPVMITDPAYNPAYSNFCYETPFMPGFTAYMDTPVTPVQAFADHYNLPDAEYPDGTPVLKRADFSGLIGPWAPNTSTSLVLTSYGDRVVQNPAYTGPSGVSSATATWGSKTLKRHYGFGAQCTATGPGCAAISSVTIGGLAATINSWSDASITVTVPSGLPTCPGPSQQRQTAARCGEVVITAGNGKQSFDGITVTIGGKAPQVIEPNCSASGACTTAFGEFYPNPLQTAIDKATPGDLIIVDAGTYRENLIMWKPVRLQGVGAGAVTINADAQPAGKMDAWRRRVSCLFGLTVQGAPLTEGPASGTPNTQSVYDPTGTFTCPDNMYFRDDRLPFEGFVGWDASSNGNLAQVLQEPSLMGAYEGAGITVLGRGINQNGSGNRDLWGQIGGAGQFADGSRYVNDGTVRRQPNDCNTATASATYADYGTANFQCNPSRIDGLSIINSSQGGGGIFMHGWNNNLQIANNRISANAGTLSGGINLGNGETPPAFTLDNITCGNTGAVPAPLCPPIPAGTPLGAQIPFAMNTNVHVHHNQVIDNASIGDALFSGSPSGAGGITVSAGADGYEIDHNWVAANLTSGDGGGIAHMGVSFNGKIDHNVVIFNESNNPTLPVDGGGIVIMGAQEDRTLASTGQECGGTSDVDCPPGIGDGTGPGLLIDSNLLLGNSALYGSGGGLRLRQTNGSEVAAFPTRPDNWYGITVTNNIIVDNVAGWDGGGVSLQDSFKTKFVNNTVAANDTTASAGVLFKTLGAINAASPPPGCLPTPDPTQPQNPNCLNPNAPHIPQPAGLVTMQNTPNMMSQFATASRVVCPAGFGYGIGSDAANDPSLVDGRCMLVSLPSIVNDLFWQNRAFHVEIVGMGSGSYSLQNIVALFPQANQQVSGQCVAPSSMSNADGSPFSGELYWDLGVRMDLLPNNNGHSLVFNSATVGGGYTLEAGATATVAGGVITKVTVTNQGAGYTAAPAVTFVGGGGTGATGVAHVARGVVVSVSLTSGGTGYTSAPFVQFTGGGLGVNRVFNNNSTGIALVAKNSILSDRTNLLNITGINNLAPGSAPLQGQYCNGARIPPEQCSTSQGANNPLMCKGYFAPAGQSETAGVPTVFTFNNIQAAATVDEGNNWINMTYGPLTLSRPLAGEASAEPTVAAASVAASTGAYTVGSGSAAIGAGTGITAQNGVPALDYFGQRRSTAAVTIGAVEYMPAAPTLTSISPSTGMQGTSVLVTLIGTNFAPGATLNVVCASNCGFNNGITVGNVTVLSATQITATFQISATATTSVARSVTVTTTGGTTSALTFNVTKPAAPTLTGISPSSGSRSQTRLGSSVTVTLQGTNFPNSGLSVAVTCGLTRCANGIVAMPMAVNNGATPNTVTVTFLIAANATLGARSVTVTTPGGTSTTSAQTFTVTP